MENSDYERGYKIGMAVMRAYVADFLSQSANSPYWADKVRGMDFPTFAPAEVGKLSAWTPAAPLVPGDKVMALGCLWEFDGKQMNMVKD